MDNAERIERLEMASDLLNEAWMALEGMNDEAHELLTFKVSFLAKHLHPLLDKQEKAA